MIIDYRQNLNLHQRLYKKKRYVTPNFFILFVAIEYDL